MRHQVGGGLLEVEIGVDVGAGTDRHQIGPLGDVFLVAPVIDRAEIELDDLVAGHRLQLAHRVGEDQRVRAVVVLEEVHDAFVLEQALHEAQVALVVLDAIFPLRIGRLQALLELGLGIFGEDRLDDLDHGLLLEDPAVRGVAQEPEPGPDDRLVAGKPLLHARQPEIRALAAEPALRLVLRLDRDRLAEHRHRVDIDVLADEGDRVGVAGADLVVPFEAREDQRASGRCPRNGGAVLCHDDPSKAMPHSTVPNTSIGIAPASKLRRAIAKCVVDRLRLAVASYRALNRAVAYPPWKSF